MLMRMSTLFLRTLREDPADAEVPGHRLLVRAGYIRRAAPGGFTWLPLGKLVLDRVTAIVREEMAAIGAQEVSFPALLPVEPYETSGRSAEYGAGMFRLTDRRGADFVLAPTHEEMFTTLVRDICSSHRDYPLTLFQVQTKYRDEARPRGGLLRGREFVMKDSYSFDLTDHGLVESYSAHRAAYKRIFDRLGLRYAICAAQSGAMGGAASEEFLAETAVGEDTYASCDSCGYAANTEKVTTPAPAPETAEHPAVTVHHTPGATTVQALVDQLGVAADEVLKNIVVTVTPPRGAAELLVIGVPGDRDVDMKRLEAVLYPATVELLTDFAAHPDLVRGFIGPQGMKHRYLVDPRVVAGTAWATGANEPDHHALNVVCGRDFTPDGTIEVVTVRAGDPCPSCGAGLGLRRGVEIGHIFQLGRRYADAFGLDALGPDGKPVRVTMGSYGIGISRLVAAVAEQTLDEHGLRWPTSIAPGDVHLVVAGKGDQQAAAEQLASELVARGLRVLLDDRAGVSAGVKFADAELIGIPSTVVVGRRSSEGYAELRNRWTGARAEVAIADLPDTLLRERRDTDA